MTHVMWVDADDDHVLINTEVHRAFKAITRDPRATVTIWHRDDPYTSAEVRGTVVETVRGPDARVHIDKLSQKYRGRDYDSARITSERVILRRPRSSGCTRARAARATRGRAASADEP